MPLVDESWQEADKRVVLVQRRRIVDAGAGRGIGTRSIIKIVGRAKWKRCAGKYHFKFAYGKREGEKKCENSSWMLLLDIRVLF